MPGDSASLRRLRAAKEARDAKFAAGGLPAPDEGLRVEYSATTVGPLPDEATSALGIQRRDGTCAAGSGPTPDHDTAPVIAIVKVAGRLPADAPPTVVRHEDGRIFVDTRDRRQVDGRGLRDVHDVIAMPGLGAHLVDAMFRRAAARADSVWVGYAVAARLIVVPLRDLGLADSPPSALPFDLFPQIEDALRRRSRVVTLPDATRKTLNSARWLIGAIPGCAHVDVTPDTFRTGDRPQWGLVNGDPEPIVRTAWGDADTERLVKRCSDEILRQVSGWNQFVEFVRTGEITPGPHELPELSLAKDLFLVDARLPPSWEVAALDRRVAKAILEVGIETVRSWGAASPDGAGLEIHQKRAIEILGKIEAGDMVFRWKRGQRNCCAGIMRAGWAKAVAIAYPTARAMAPFSALLAIQSRLNVDPLLTLGDEEFGIFDDDAPGEADDPGGPAQKRLRGAPFKARSRRLYPVDFPVTVEIDDPAPLIGFIRSWTLNVREVAGADESRLFIYIGRLSNSGKICSFARSGYRKGFPLELEMLCDRAGVPRITPRELRRIGIDIVHEACDGDPVTMKAAGDWRDLGTGEKHYFSPSIVMRGQESIGWALKIEERRLFRGIEVLGRPLGSDLFSATDGFSCGNPLDGPDPQEPGDLCHARGLCAICPNAEVDMADPAWSFASMATLAAGIEAGLCDDPDPRWVARYLPALEELREFWLPEFPNGVVAAARRLPDMSCGELRA